MHSVVRHTLLEDYEAMKILVGVECTAMLLFLGGNSAVLGQ